MKKLRIALILAIVGIGIWPFAALLVGQTKPANAEREFTCEYVALRLKNGERDWIKDPYIKVLAGKKFICGVALDQIAAKPINGCTVSIAFDEISQILEFVDRKSMDDAGKGFAKSDEAPIMPPPPPLFAPNAPGEDDQQVHLIPCRSMRIPVKVADDDRQRLEKILLFVSSDRGKTWEYYDEFKPTCTAMRFLAPHDGEYWFSIQQQMVGGTFTPEGPHQFLPKLKVRVRENGDV